jgi:hypothetical protein
MGQSRSDFMLHPAENLTLNQIIIGTGRNLDVDVLYEQARK